MRVLVFGATGFTGHYLCKSLARNSNIKIKAISSRNVDIRNKDQVKLVIEGYEPKVVVNLAGISYVDTAEIQKIYDINSFGQLNLLESLEELGFRGKLIFASSGNIYGNNTKTSISEDQCPDPINHYSFSKLLAENFCKLFQDKFKIIITRPFSCIGCGQAPIFLLPKIVEHFKDKKTAIELGNVDVQRDFVDIRDIASMYHTLIVGACPYNVVHFSNDDTHSIREILKIMTELSGHKIDVVINPKFVRSNDLLYQRGANDRIKSFGYSRQYSFFETMLWLYTGPDCLEQT